ncbi:MAG: hypothetical protein D3923_10565 [Candidatus Electrothrix sp. AR3]|nr:hypothetical protein [Candidatus Electrothrix sp. AR3]
MWITEHIEDKQLKFYCQTIAWSLIKKNSIKFDNMYDFCLVKLNVIYEMIIKNKLNFIIEKVDTILW